MNSYLGIMQHYKTYKMRKNMLFKNLDKIWWQYFYLSKNAKNLKRIIAHCLNYRFYDDTLDIHL